MNVAINLIVLIVFIILIQKRISGESNKKVFPIIALFMLCSTGVFVVSLFAQNEFLDGLHYIIAWGTSHVIYWIWTSIAVIRKHVQSGKQNNLAAQLLSTSILILVPLIVWGLMSGMSHKIGG